MSFARLKSSLSPMKMANITLKICSLALGSTSRRSLVRQLGLLIASNSIAQVIGGKVGSSSVYAWSDQGLCATIDLRVVELSLGIFIRGGGKKVIKHTLKTQATETTTLNDKDIYEQSFLKAVEIQGKYSLHGASG